jgi:hypothetical protein
VEVQCDADVPSADPGLVTASDNCTADGDLVVEFGGDSSSGSCPTVITRTYRVTDECGNTAECQQIITVNDTVPPVITCPPDTSICEGQVLPPDTGSVTATDNCTAPQDILIEFVGDIDVGGMIIRTYRATDGCGNFADCEQLITIAPPPPCSVSGPGAVNENTTATYCAPAVPGGSYEWSTIGACSISGPDDGQCVDVTMSDWPGQCTVQLTVTSAEGCTSSCNLIVTLVCVDGCPEEPGGCSEKGSLLVFSKVEIRWDADGNVLQDTFISILNDFNEDVQVQMYFINGDPPLPANGGERAHQGWNWVDNVITLTKNEPAYWSALTGEPKGVSPFQVLDPGMPPGRPCPDGSGDRCLRGYILAWAVNNISEEIRWNHLAGSATLVNYGNSSAWEYNACALPVVDQSIPNGAKLPTPGVLNLDGMEYATWFDQLVMDFYASGSQPFGPGGAPTDIVVETDLTLHPVDVDLRQETDGPVTTKASFSIWNQNEVKFSGTDRCITCWDQTLLRDYDLPNHFLRQNLQTDKGRARIDGLESQVCDDPLAVEPIFSQEAALMGVVAKFLNFANGTSFAASGTNLHGIGTQHGTIQYDVNFIPPEAITPQNLIDVMLRSIDEQLRPDPPGN